METMSFTILGFQVYNLNDYDVKLFAKFDEDQLYIAKLQLLEKYPDVDAEDEGSSQRFDKLQFSSDGKHDVLKNFPFSALFKSELTLIKPKSTKLSNIIALYNEEYNYILILYADSEATTHSIEKYLAALQVPSQETASFQAYIAGKIDELDDKIFKESLGQKRLLKKINPRVTRELKILAKHVKIIDDDEKYVQTYATIIREFDEEFLHSEDNKYEFHSSTTQKSI
jgi:hypothetical protein